MGKGPLMAKIQRANGSCYWIDTTEVTEGQYADYLAANPTPINDALCSGPSNVDGQCEGRLAADSGTGKSLPKTCVDWCEARGFCGWAKKALCRDKFSAVGPELQIESDFVIACTEAGTNSQPYGEDCGALACRVSGGEPLPAGKINDCWVHAADDTTQVYDLIGNVEEWTASCQSMSPSTPCTVRGGSFGGFDQLRCCAQKTQLDRRRSTPTLGFRCCAYP